MTEEKTENLNESDQFISDTDSEETLLPRSGWNSQLSYLRAMFRTKKALDGIEKEAGISLNLK